MGVVDEAVEDQDLSGDQAGAGGMWARALALAASAACPGYSEAFLAGCQAAVERRGASGAR